MNLPNLTRKKCPKKSNSPDIDIAHSAINRRGSGLYSNRLWLGVLGAWPPYGKSMCWQKKFCQLIEKATNFAKLKSVTWERLNKQGRPAKKILGNLENICWRSSGRKNNSIGVAITSKNFLLSRLLMGKSTVSRENRFWDFGLPFTYPEYPLNDRNGFFLNKNSHKVPSSVLTCGKVKIFLKPITLYTLALQKIDDEKSILRFWSSLYPDPK